MLTPATRTKIETTENRPMPAVLARPASEREVKEMPRGDLAAPRTHAASSPDDWTRECLFDCYND